MGTLSRALIAFLLATQALFGPVWAQNYSDEELQDLVGPIALYPDPLLSSVLVASSFPDQVQAAHDYVIRDGHSDVSSQGWDESVKALCSYSEVLTMLGGSPDYVSALGWAMANQPQTITDAVQSYRYQVKRAGNLQSDDAVNVVEEGVVIRIVPRDPEVIYVPTYDPVVVREPDPVGRALVYGAGVAINALLWKNVLDWDDRRFYRSPVGWVAPAAYYRPYGWRRDAGWGGSVWRPNQTTIINRPVNINNIQIAQGNGNRYPIRPNRPVNRPGIANPNRPGIANPNRPGIANPNRPGIANPNRPGIAYPNRPGIANPNRPGIANPNRPGIANPNRPGIANPNRPGIANPNRPGIANPNRPGIANPNRPGIANPNRPGIANPNRPGIANPNRPGIGNRPQVKPAPRPTVIPSNRPAPNARPTARPNARPTARPNTRPTARPNMRPTARPNTRPTARPNTRPAGPRSGATNYTRPSNATRESRRGAASRNTRSLPTGARPARRTR